jgi:hypothetical protein
MRQGFDEVAHRCRKLDTKFAKVTCSDSTIVFEQDAKGGFELQGAVVRSLSLAALALWLLGAAPVAPLQPEAPQPRFDPSPWLADLAEMRTALKTRYANLPWLLTDRALDLDGLFVRAESALGSARDDAGAMRVFDRIVERIDDGHVRIEWLRPSRLTSAPVPSASPAAVTSAAFCAARGYGGSSPATEIAPALPGYTALWSGDLLPGGTFAAGQVRAGIIRIGKFDPHGSPSLCDEAVRTLRVPLDRPCDEACNDAILTFAYRKLTATLEQRLQQLNASGANLLAVDITGNGGGSEWTEAAARMISARPLTSAQHGFVRGAHWERLWREQAERLRDFAAKARGKERTALLVWAANAQAAVREAQRRCPPTGDPNCPWLGSFGYSTGLVGMVTAEQYADREWGVHIFNPGQHPYRDAIWSKPVMVLTDEETHSAAEQFAALLQDNRAALIVGSRTGGSGCGYSWGGAPARLPGSGAILHLPDCARFRADGTNEVRGIMPDVLVPGRANDGKVLRGQLLGKVLPFAAERAISLDSEASIAPDVGTQAEFPRRLPVHGKL